MVGENDNSGTQQMREMLAQIRELSSEMPKSENRRPITAYIWLLAFIIFASVAVSSWIQEI